MNVMARPVSRKVLSLIFWSFLFFVVGHMPMYVNQPTNGWLTVLRHLKTVPYTYSLFILAAAIIIFINEMAMTSILEDADGCSEQTERPDSSTSK